MVPTDEPLSHIARVTSYNYRPQSQLGLKQPFNSLVKQWDMYMNKQERIHTAQLNEHIINTELSPAYCAWFYWSDTMQHKLLDILNDHRKAHLDFINIIISIKSHPVKIPKTPENAELFPRPVESSACCQFLRYDRYGYHA